MDKILKVASLAVIALISQGNALMELYRRCLYTVWNIERVLALIIFQYNSIIVKEIKKKETKMENIKNLFYADFLENYSADKYTFRRDNYILYYSIENIEK